LPVTTLTDQIAVVTGSSSGVGKALALGYVASRFAKDGQAVMVTGPEDSRSGRVYLRAIYDPEGTRVRS